VLLRARGGLAAVIATSTANDATIMAVPISKSLRRPAVAVEPLPVIWLSCDKCAGGRVGWQAGSARLGNTPILSTLAIAKPVAMT